MGLPLHEHMPHETIFDAPHLVRIRLKSFVDAPITYFDLRASLTPVGKKRADMAFLTHVIQKCDRSAENASRIERMHYFTTKLRYFPELWYVNRHIGTPKVDNYMLRWGYLLEHDPSFGDLVHGADNLLAWYCLKNLE